MTPLDVAIAFVHIAGFSVAKATKAVLVNVVGPGGPPDLANLEKDDQGETAPAQEAYASLGRIFAPRRPTKLDGKEVRPEGVAIRRANGMVPIAYRDLRLHRFFPNPKEGTIADVGYAGAFDSNEPTFNPNHTPKSSIRTIYVPYAFNGQGVATKACVITIDTTANNAAISIIHGEGMAITMLAGGKNSVVVKNKAGNAYVEVNDDGVTVNGNTVVNGIMAVGPVGATPVALATPLTAFLTILATWAVNVTAAVNGLAPGSVTAPPPTPAPSVAATKLSTA